MNFTHPVAVGLIQQPIRIDLQLIADMIEPDSRVLDIGCGDGTLLNYLVNFRQVDGRGIELSSEGVNACVAAGLPVIQGDAETDLAEYPDQAFDYVVLSQTLQAMRRPRETILQLLRIGQRAIVSMPNFGYWRLRCQLLVTGRMPDSEALSCAWYDTPNIHLCTIRDFVALCDADGFAIERGLYIRRDGRPRPLSPPLFVANLLGEQVVLVLRR